MRVVEFDAHGNRVALTLYDTAAGPARHPDGYSRWAGYYDSWGIQIRAEFFDVYLEMAVDFRLPLRMAGASAERLIGFPYRRLADEEGVVFPDHFVYTSVGSRRGIEKALFDLAPGVTEVYLHPGIDTDELRASHPDWANRVEDHAYLTRDPSLRDLIDRAGVTLLGYRALRELQRSSPRRES